jgi:hypothetical protein
MRYIRVENPVKVVPSMEMLRILGASSSREDAERIGQFGTGTPFSWALLVRKGIKSKHCMGKDVYTIETKGSVAKTSRGEDFEIQELILRKQNGPTVNLGISTEFGALDWTDETMALREFISNAIDGATDNGFMPWDVKIEIVEENQTRAKDGTIRVYVQATEELEEYVRDIGNHFLCLNPSYDSAKTVMPNKNGGPARFYRKGVHVGSFGDQSLFNYNIHDLDLKESRIVDSYHAKEKAARAIAQADVSIIAQYLQGWQTREEWWEKSLDSYDFNLRWAEQEVLKNWSQAYKQVYGDAVICETPEIAHIVRSKGKMAQVFPERLVSLVRSIPGVQDSSAILTKDEVDGRNILPPTDDVTRIRDRVWEFLFDHALCNGKDIPDVHCFSEITRQEGTRLGFYRDDTVYINLDICQDCPMLLQTMIEEIAHHVTGARDCTRDFQDFAFRLAVFAF